MRRAVTVRLSPEARDHLASFCEEHGITAAAAFEWLCLALPDLTDAERSELVRMARHIDRQRRSRS